MDLSCFGIEFETCVCDTSADYTNVKPNELYYDIERYRNKLQAINDYLGTGAKFESSDDPRTTNYGVWMATIDRSIRCEVSDSKFLTSSRLVDKTKDCVFTSVELVSPKMAYTKDEYSKFTRVLNDVILNEKFEYDVNKSQGMHTNISHPDQDKLKMLKAWWYFEPIILTFVPPERRRASYAIPVRERFKTITDLIDNWETFYEDPDRQPAKYTALCVKNNRFEVRIVQANMNSDHITAWLTFCIRFLFASITKSVEFDFTLIPTIEDLFDFVDVDPSNPVDSLREYFYSIESVKIGRTTRELINSYSMLELIKSGDEEAFIKIASKSSETAITLLNGSIPIIPSLNILKFFRIVLSKYVKITYTESGSELTEGPELDAIIKAYISEAFTKNMTSIRRAYDPAFYREYVYFADHELAIEILKTSLENNDYETAKRIVQTESCMITWDDMLKFDDDQLIEYYQNPLPPDDMEEIKSWKVVKKILEKYPEVQLDIFPWWWVELDIITEQFEMVSKYDDIRMYVGFMNRITHVICDNSPEYTSIIPTLLIIVSKIVNILFLDKANGRLTNYINSIFLCQNAFVNVYINRNILDGNIELCEAIIQKLVELNEDEDETDTSSELINDCLRVIPRERIIGKYKMIDEILSL